MTASPFIDWHPAPRRQYVITLSGESEVEVAGGQKFRAGPGHLMLADDTTGQGHISRAVPGKERVALFITVADGADFLK
jgi:quercetin dioxygenase-like cupin family protein